MAPILRPRYLLAAGLPSSARYAATVSVRGLLVAEIQVLVPYRIHPSIHPPGSWDPSLAAWPPSFENKS